MRDPLRVDEQIVRLFFETVFKHCPPDYYTTVNRWEKDWTGKADKPKSFSEAPQVGAVDEILRWGREYMRKQTDVYFRPTVMANQPPPGTRGKKEHTSGYCVLYADLDYYKVEGWLRKPAEVAEKEVTEALEKLALPPTIAIHTGEGIQVYWLLDRFETDIEALEARNRWLEQSFEAYGGDPASAEAAHLYRFPGTQHWKGGHLGMEKDTRVLWIKPERVYRMEQFGTAAAKAKPTTNYGPILEEEPIEDEEQFLADIKQRHEALYQRIYSEATALEAGATQKGQGRVNRSDNDMWIANCLLGMGYSPGIAASVLMHPTWFSGERFREDSSKGQGKAYVEVTVNNALNWVGSPEGTSGAGWGRFFDQKTFRPKLVVTELLKNYCLLIVGSAVAYYEGGVYRVPEAEDRDPLRFIVSDMLGDVSTSDYIDKVIDLCRDTSEIPTWDGIDPARYINFRNGLLDLETRQLVSHTPAVHSTYQFPVDYLPDADTTAVDAYIAELFEPDAIPVFWEYIGTCYWYGKWTKYFMLCPGESNSGKNSLMRIILDQMGPGAKTLSLHQITSDRWSMGDLFRCPINLCDESSNIKLDELSRLKSLYNGAGTPITGERKFKNKFKFIPTVKGIFFCNGLPSIVAVEDGAAFNRMLILRFRQVFQRTAEGERKIVDLMTKHRAAFAARAMCGLFRLIDNNEVFTESVTMAKAKEAYISENNPLATFLEVYCLTGEDLADLPEKRRYTTKEDLHVYYTAVCELHKETHPLNIRRFKEKLEVVGVPYGVKREQILIPRPNGKSTPQEVWTGIRPVRLTTELKLFARGDERFALPNTPR